MKSVISILAGLSFATFASALPVTEISLAQKGGTVFHNIKEVKVIEEVVDLNNPTSSKVVLEIKGTYEGNLCGGTTVAVQFSDNAANCGLECSVRDVTLFALNESKEISLTPYEACAEYSISQPFSMRVVQPVNYWAPTLEEISFQYNFLSYGQSKVGQLNLVFSKIKGWKISSKTGE